MLEGEKSIRIAQIALDTRSSLEMRPFFLSILKYEYGNMLRGHRKSD